MVLSRYKQITCEGPNGVRKPNKDVKTFSTKNVETVQKQRKYFLSKSLQRWDGKNDCNGRDTVTFSSSEHYRWELFLRAQGWDSNLPSSLEPTNIRSVHSGILLCSFFKFFCFKQYVCPKYLSSVLYGTSREVPPVLRLLSFLPFQIRSRK